MKIDKDTQCGVLLSLALRTIEDLKEIAASDEAGSKEMECASEKMFDEFKNFSDAWRESRKSRNNL